MNTVHKWRRIMAIEEFLIFGIPVSVLALSIFLAYRYAKDRNGKVLGVLGAIWALFTGWMFVGMEVASGWDGLIYLLGLFCISAPASVGGLIGGIIGWVKKDNERFA
ncbi:hypothetical protein [Cognatiyoonia sp. IB215182]|uniref:hypothetical protein n=1 Tax=Cognatiyoonia sp. IB215182 TaxID=3097353 RepID=UPI002A2476E3|nr:hypothetical protein [Cognatiyoonia sp. IB215182]